jgi:CRISPR system Cascade subunit CasD
LEIMPKQPLLVLRLEGPLQSWGLRARWDVRDTGDEPSKSGVIGLLGCALGYKVGDPQLEYLGRELTLGVRVEHPGQVMVDYQTITGLLPTAEGGYKGTPDDPATIVSPRSYLQDASFLVVLAGAEELLRSIAQALASPKWPVYLGRKSCPPARPVLEEVTAAYATPREALENYPWDWCGRAHGAKPVWLVCWLEDGKGDFVRPDQPQANPARMYANRRLVRYTVPCPEAKEDDEQCTSHA